MILTISEGVARALSPGREQKHISFGKGLGHSSGLRTLKFVGQAGYVFDRGCKFFSAFRLLTCGGRGLRRGVAPLRFAAICWVPATTWRTELRMASDAAKTPSTLVPNHEVPTSTLARRSKTALFLRISACDAAHHLKVSAYGGDLILDRERHIFRPACAFRRLPRQFRISDDTTAKPRPNSRALAASTEPLTASIFVCTATNAIPSTIFSMRRPDFSKSRAPFRLRAFLRSWRHGGAQCETASRLAVTLGDNAEARSSRRQPPLRIGGGIFDLASAALDCWVAAAWAWAPRPI